MTRTLFLVAFVVMLAGCSDDAAMDDSAPDDTEIPDDPLTSTAVERQETILHTADIVVVPGKPYTASVEVPNGTTDIVVEIAGSHFNGGPSVGAGLTGCNAFEGNAVAIGPGGTGTIGFGLCDIPEPGSQTLSVTATAGVLQGTMVLKGQVPTSP